MPTVLVSHWGQQKNGKNKGKAPAATGAASTSSTDKDSISPAVKEVVRRCLKVEPAERPDIDELIQLVEVVIAELPSDDDDGD